MLHASEAERTLKQQKFLDFVLHREVMDKEACVAWIEQASAAPGGATISMYCCTAAMVLVLLLVLLNYRLCWTQSFSPAGQRLKPLRSCSH